MSLNNPGLAACNKSIVATNLLLHCVFSAEEGKFLLEVHFYDE